MTIYTGQPVSLEFGACSISRLIAGRAEARMVVVDEVLWGALDGVWLSRIENRALEAVVQSAPKILPKRLFRFGRRLALVAMAADELVVWGGIAILAR